MIGIKRVCLLLAVIGLVEEVVSIEKPTAFDYHRRFGISKAREIKKWEEENVGRSENSRIIGGWHVNINQVPYQAGLVIQMNVIYQSVCGASLISQTRLVTAAHCWNDGINLANSFTVVLGSSFLFSGGQRIFTTDVVMNPSWNYETLEADIAVIRIHSVSFSNVIQPISLPNNNEMHFRFEGAIAMASGFGLTVHGGTIPISQHLSAVHVPVMNEVACKNFYGTWMRDSNICTDGAGKKGTCNGDSGGPLVVNLNGRLVLVGVTSFGSWYGCEASDPSVFARVTSFVNWIHTI